MPALLERDLDQLTCDAYNDDPTRVRRVARLMPSDDAFDRAAIILKALADPVRARILFALSQSPLCVCELSVLLGMSLPAISHHLKLLTTAGLLKVRKEGKFAVYHLCGEHQGATLGALLTDLTQPQEGRR